MNGQGVGYAVRRGKRIAKVNNYRLIDWVGYLLTDVPPFTPFKRLPYKARITLFLLSLELTHKSLSYLPNPISNAGHQRLKLAFLSCSRKPKLTSVLRIPWGISISFSLVMIYLIIQNRYRVNRIEKVCLWSWILSLSKKSRNGFWPYLSKVYDTVHVRFPVISLSLEVLSGKNPWLNS